MVLLHGIGLGLVRLMPTTSMDNTLWINPNGQTLWTNPHG